jgi:hypothetical protein
MVPSHRELGFAEVAALFPGDWIFGEFLLAALGVVRNKVMAGGTPANPAALVSFVALPATNCCQARHSPERQGSTGVVVRTRDVRSWAPPRGHTDGAEFERG